MITVDKIKELRDKTGVSIMQCRKALEEAGGDFGKAEVLLRKQSQTTAEKKADRELNSGCIQSYIHSNAMVGAMVELSCETDFVAKNKEFKDLAYDLAMQVAATDAKYVKKEEIPEDDKKKASEVFEKEVANKPDDLKEKIIEGKLDDYFADKVLLEQGFIKDPEMKIKDLITSAIQKFGEKVEIRRFVKFSI